MGAIAVLGDINVDLTLRVDTYPPEGGEGIAESQMHGLGGSAANTALILAGLGKSVRFIGKTGADAWGEWCRSEMAAAGIDTSGISIDANEPTQTNLVIVSGVGERTMFAYRGANARLEPHEVDHEALEGCALLHVSGYALLQRPQRDAALRAVETAVRAEIPVTLDIPAGVAPRIGHRVRSMLPDIATLFLGTADICIIADQQGNPELAAARLLDRGVGAVVVKRGAGGCDLHERGRTLRMATVAVLATDTTGAGDAFAAGYIFGIAQGLSAAARCTLANAAGALAVTRRGSGASSIDRSALLAQVEAVPDRRLVGEIYDAIGG